MAGPSRAAGLESAYGLLTQGPPGPGFHLVESSTHPPELSASWHHKQFRLGREADPTQRMPALQRPRLRPGARPRASAASPQPRGQSGAGGGRAPSSALVTCCAWLPSLENGPCAKPRSSLKKLCSWHARGASALNGVVLLLGQPPGASGQKRHIVQLTARPFACGQPMPLMHEAIQAPTDCESLPAGVADSPKGTPEAAAPAACGQPAPRPRQAAAGRQGGAHLPACRTLRAARPIPARWCRQGGRASRVSAAPGRGGGAGSPRRGAAPAGSSRPACRPGTAGCRRPGCRPTAA